MTENSTEVEVALPDHGLSPGDTITVEGAASVSGIPSSRINGEQLVTRTERDSLFFGVPFAASCSATGRDGCVTIATATPFRLVFDTPDSMGALPGFVESDHTDYKPAHISKNYDESGRTRPLLPLFTAARGASHNDRKSPRCLRSTASHIPSGYGHVQRFLC